MSDAPALALELSCRYLSPLLETVNELKQSDELHEFLKTWGVEVDDLREQSNWVSLRFCEALTEWVGARIGADQLCRRMVLAFLSPRALGFMYPFVRTIGSPGDFCRRLPHVVRMLNKVSEVRILGMRRGFAEIEYRPIEPQFRERSPFICQLRKAQIAAGPTVWHLPAARVDEIECQAQGGESCRYHVWWVERARWRGSFIGLGVGALTAAMLSHGVLAVVSPVLLGVALGRLWDQRAHIRELRAFAEDNARGLHDALEAAERRFLELQRAKAEVDSKVEQRTAELKTATERRVHTEKLAVLGTLAAGLAHEVRNPASAIVTGLRPVKRHIEQLGADPDDMEVVDIAIEAGEQISRLVGDLLDVGRTDRGLEPWDPHHGIEAAIRLLSHHAEGVVFERDFQFPGQVVGRPPALNQIFLNLLDNAVRAAGQGGRVHIASRSHDGGVEMTIRDSGSGVSEEDAKHIFDPFFTTRAIGEGTGLGLHFSRQVAYDHGGTLDLVPSSPGWGASFRLWLPIKPRPLT